jgi:hypothetical protein
MMLKPLKVIDIIRELPPGSTPNEAVLAVWEAQGIIIPKEQKQAITQAFCVGTIRTTFSRVWKAKKK